MIFKRLFQRAHQHPDPEKRLASINGLDPKQDKDKQILHELAFNDESAKVSVAALDALSSFTLWMKAYETHFHQKVQLTARAQVLKLLEDPEVVNDKLLIDIAKQNKHNVLLREMVFTSKRLFSMEALCVEMVLTICADNEVRRFYSERANNKQKLAIIDTLDEKALRRFRKSESAADVSAYIDDKLSALALAAQKPKKVLAAATLINSRLLAISDLLDYESIQRQKRVLVNEFDALKSEFTVLSDEDSAQLTSKYFTIKERVDKRLTQLEPDYMAHVHLSGVTDAISDIQNRAAIIFQQIDILSETDSPEQLTSQVELLDRSIDDLRLELSDINAQTKSAEGHGQTTAAHRGAIIKLENAFNERQGLLHNLPEAIARNAQIDELLSKANFLLESEATEKVHSATTNPENLTVDNSSEPNKSADPQTLGDVLKRLESLMTSGTNPARLASIKAIKKTLQDKRKETLEASKNLEKRCFAKLNVCLNMIEQGKFKVAISTFNTAQKLLAQVEPKSPSLARRCDEVQQKIGELKDWQSYIAAPKKPALIAAANTLADNEEMDIAERAKLVKQYRAEFVTLGRLHTDDDDALNKEFDTAIEKAFAPCRAYYAQLDSIREQNLQKGKQVLDALEALREVADPVTLAKHLTSISQQYRKLGDIDKQARSQLHKDYQQKLKPLQERVSAYYQDNAMAKQKLIDKALKLNEGEDIESAASVAKGLQSEWKALGFAGAKQDQELWQRFREANDAIFKRLQDTIAEQKHAAHVQVQAIKAQLDALSSAITQSQQLSDLNEVDRIVDQIKVAIEQLPRPQQQAQSNKLAAHQATLAHKIKSFENNKQNAVLENVFDILAKHDGKLSAEQLAALPSQFKQAFEPSFVNDNAPSVLVGMSRQQLNMAADILLADGKGYADSVQKKDVQLKLMAAKLEGQIMPDADAILVQWIGVGKLADGDVDLLAKFKSLYTTASKR
ncbi:DUF349 domain-containing protein [Glaciecola sp. SC05]|uniref:DUF349 domain-containing protein n=1 Tax=Glaciecola sp. SC05 TaxID=1987355 RepID=UPI0035285AB6